MRAPYLIGDQINANSVDIKIIIMFNMYFTFLTTHSSIFFCCDVLSVGVPVPVVNKYFN